MLKLILLILIHDTILASGQTFIKQAMNTLGDVDMRSFKGILYFIKFCVTRTKIWAGFSLNTVSFMFWLVILSIADLSLAYPLDSLHYIVAAFLAKFTLKENIGWLRWAGILLVVLGVSVVSFK